MLFLDDAFGLANQVETSDCYAEIDKGQQEGEKTEDRCCVVEVELKRAHKAGLC